MFASFQSIQLVKEEPNFNIRLKMIAHLTRSSERSLPLLLLIEEHLRALLPSRAEAEHEEFMLNIQQYVRHYPTECTGNECQMLSSINEMVG